MPGPQDGCVDEQIPATDTVLPVPVQPRCLHQQPLRGRNTQLRHTFHLPRSVRLASPVFLDPSLCMCVSLSLSLSFSLFLCVCVCVCLCLCPFLCLCRSFLGSVWIAKTRMHAFALCLLAGTGTLPGRRSTHQRSLFFLQRCCQHMCAWGYLGFVHWAHAILALGIAAWLHSGWRWIWRLPFPLSPSRASLGSAGVCCLDLPALCHLLRVPKPCRWSRFGTVLPRQEGWKVGHGRLIPTARGAPCFKTRWPEGVSVRYAAR